MSPTQGSTQLVQLTNAVAYAIKQPSHVQILQTLCPGALHRITEMVTFAICSRENNDNFDHCIIEEPWKTHPLPGYSLVTSSPAL